MASLNEVISPQQVIYALSFLVYAGGGYIIFNHRKDFLNQKKRLEVFEDKMEENVSDIKAQISHLTTVNDGLLQLFNNVDKSIDKLEKNISEFTSLIHKSQKELQQDVYERHEKMYDKYLEMLTLVNNK